MPLILFRGESVEVGGGSCVVYEMQNDGNSLFASFTHQKYKHNPYSEEHKAALEEARETVAKYINDNLYDMEDTLIAHCNRQTELYDNVSTREHKLKAFISNLKDGTESGGLEVVPALASCHDCNITVYHEKQRTLMYNPEGRVEIKVVEREPLTPGLTVHYDNFLKFNATCTSE